MEFIKNGKAAGIPNNIKIAEQWRDSDSDDDSFIMGPGYRDYHIDRW